MTAAATRVPAKRRQEKKVVEMLVSRTKGMDGAGLAGSRLGDELCLWAPGESRTGFATLLAVKGGGAVLTLHDHGWEGEEPTIEDVREGEGRSCEFGSESLSLAAMDLALFLYGLELDE